MTGIIDSIIQGILTGFGSAIGSYIGLTYGVKHIKRIPILKKLETNEEEEQK